MTNWKEQIDRELGNERKFHDALQQQILARIEKQRAPKQKRFVATLIGACVVALLLVLTMPKEMSVPKQHAEALLISDKLDVDFDVFYLSRLSSKNEQFLARPSALTYGTKRYSGLDNVKMLASVLRSMELAEEVSGGLSKDLIVKLDNGELIKLKLYNHVTWLGIYDVNTKLYYVAEGARAEQLIDIAFGSSLSIIQISILMFVYIVSMVLLPRIMKTKQNKKDKSVVIFSISILLFFLLQMANMILSVWLPMLAFIAYYAWQIYQLKQANVARNEIRLAITNGCLMSLIWLAFAWLM